MAEFQDRVLKCVDCGADFVFTRVNSTFTTTRISKTSLSAAKVAKPSARVDLGLASPRANAHFVLAVRARDHRAFQAHAGTPGILPRVLPKPQDCTGCGGRGLELRELAIRSATAGSHDDGGVRAALPGARSVEHQGLAHRL